MATADASVNTGQGVLAGPAAAARALAIVTALLAFFVVGLPLQWLLARASPDGAHRLPLLFCRALLRLAKVRLSARGAPAEGGAVLLAANHVSWIDVLALGAVAPFCFLAKREVASWPLVSGFAAEQGTVFIDRARRRSILPANRAIVARLRAGRRVVLFPEGTTRGEDLPGRFLSSHFAACLVAPDLLAGPPTATRSVAIQPVALVYSSPDAAWIGGATLVGHVWRTLLAPPLGCALVFGAPIACRAGDDRKTLAALAQAAVTALVVENRRCGATGMAR